MSNKDIYILGIESSCDETGIGLYSNEQGLLAHNLFSQVDLHAEYGGVVPELASLDHIQIALPLIINGYQELVNNASLNAKAKSII